MTAGFILAGGKSRRMGSDKANLRVADRALIDWIAAEVAAAAGSVTVIGGQPRPGLNVVEDLYPGIGPLGGVITALQASGADYNLIVPCDAPECDRGFLRGLLEKAYAAAASIIPTTPEGLRHPTCAVYTREAKVHLERAAEKGIRRLQQAVESIPDARYLQCEARPLLNVNTPEEWRTYLASKLT